MADEQSATMYVVVRGRITTPGKFEGCAAWVPFFWDAALRGRADCVATVERVAPADNLTIYWFTLGTTDVIDVGEWPELAGIRKVGVWCEAHKVTARTIQWLGGVDGVRAER